MAVSNGPTNFKINHSTSSPCLETTLSFHPPHRPEDACQITGLVDTGASAIAFPITLLDQCGFQYKHVGKSPVQFADKERMVDRVIAKLMVTIGKETKEVQVVGLDINKPLFGAKLFDVFGLTLDYKEKKLKKSGTLKPLQVELRETFANLDMNFVEINKENYTDYIDASLDCPIRFRLKSDFMFKACHTHIVPVTNNSASELDLELRGDKHLFVDKLLKPPAQVTNTSINSLLMTNFDNKKLFLKKGTIVAYGFPISGVINYDIVPDGLEHPGSRQETELGFTAVPVGVVQPQKSPVPGSFFKENYAACVDAVKLVDHEKCSVNMGQVFEDNSDPDNENFFGRKFEHEVDKISTETIKHVNARPETTFEEMDWTTFNINDALKKDEEYALKKLLFSHRHAFAYEKMDIANVDRSKLPEVEIETGDHPPIRSSYFRRSIKDKSIIEAEVKKMLDQRVITPSESPWSSPVVIVTKKNGDVRFCCDYRKINKITKKDSWPLPRIDEALDTLAGSKCFTSLDMFSGYWMLPLSKQAQEKTAFITHMGLYEWKVLPFGLTAAPAKYQRTMDHLLRRLKWKTCCLYPDDVCVFGQTFWEQLSRLEEVICTLDEVNMKMNPRKCFFAMDELEYLGHRVGKDGIKPAESKIKKIKDYIPPKNVSQLRSFLGLVGYYRNFVKNFARNAHPLFKLLKQNVAYDWTKDCQQAFEYLRDSQVSEPICVHYDERKEHGVFVDSCAKGIGAILKQEEIDENGKKVWKVVSYWGRALLDAETRYPATELELLGLVNACHHFRCYIHGKRVKVFTDHRALLSLGGKGLAQGNVYNRRINTWQMKLADFDLEIIYRPGITHQDADAISRMDQEQQESTEGDEEKIFFNSASFEKMGIDLFAPPGLDLIQSQKEDTFISYKVKQLSRPSSNLHRRFYVDKSTGILYRKIKTKDEPTAYAPVVPLAKQRSVLEHFHDSAVGGHRGTRKTKSGIRKCPLWWPRLNLDVEKYVRTCEQCQFKKPSGITPGSTSESYRATAIRFVDTVSMYRD